jgi:GNAT superfamily N-acetyltransferase
MADVPRGRGQARMQHNEAVAEIAQARAAADYAAFGVICRTYVDWFGERYRDVPGFTQAIFGRQDLDAELGDLSSRYGPPEGRVMLARLAGEVIGAGAYRRESAQLCELKRVFVADRARGHGLGRRLTVALMDAARRDGFTRMRLDTVDRLTEAIALYRSLGFASIAPYREYPAQLRPRMVFMEASL